MAKGLTTTDVHEILSGLVDPEMIDGTGESAKMSAEQLFLCGAALKLIAARMEKDAKAAMLPRYRGVEGKQVHGRLVVEWTPGGQPTVSLVRAAVQKEFPPEKRPEFWKGGESKEALKISIAARTVRKTRQPKKETAK